MTERRRLSGSGDGFYEEKRSRFIARITPVRTEEEAREIIHGIKKQYPDARHHVWAWILPDGSCRWSDDGEPGGTAGAPTADILKNAGLTGALCVTVRYFGGTLLGSGGLVRAYSKAAQAALEAAGTEPDPEQAGLRLTVPWDSMDRVHRLLARFEGRTVGETEALAEGAVLQAELPAEQTEAFAAAFTNATAGRGIIG